MCGMAMSALPMSETGHMTSPTPMAPKNATATYSTWYGLMARLPNRYVTQRLP